jgi:hypothetical protein
MALGKLLVALLVEKLIQHANSISPWDKSGKNDRPQSPWREFSVVLWQVEIAIVPPPPLRETLSAWHDISKSLSEPPRRRTAQLVSYFEY